MHQTVIQNIAILLIHNVAILHVILVFMSRMHLHICSFGLASFSRPYHVSPRHHQHTNSRAHSCQEWVLGRAAADDICAHNVVKVLRHLHGEIEAT